MHNQEGIKTYIRTPNFAVYFALFFGTVHMPYIRQKLNTTTHQFPINFLRTHTTFDFLIQYKHYLLNFLLVSVRFERSQNKFFPLDFPWSCLKFLVLFSCLLPQNYLSLALWLIQSRVSCFFSSSSLKFTAAFGWGRTISMHTLVKLSATMVKSKV